MTRQQCEDFHTERPGGYAEYREWCKRMARTHQQERCPVCGMWNVWVPKPKRKVRR